jgi:quinol-cytochrome oxidoreductase complex cytochrome b subunit
MIRTQTIIIGICIIITLLLSISNLFIPKANSEKTNSMFTKAKFFMLLIILLFVFPLALLQLYAVNCMLEGNCVIFTWILVIIILFYTLFYIGSFIYNLVKLRKTIASEEKH